MEAVIDSVICADVRKISLLYFKKMPKLEIQSGNFEMWLFWKSTDYFRKCQKFYYAVPKQNIK